MSDEPKQQGPKATGAGPGVLYIAFAKFYFVAIGFVIQVRLPAILSRAAFGAFSIVNNIASLANNVLVTGTIQAVSRFAAQEPEKARAVQHAGLRMHVRLGLPIAIAFVAASPLVAWLLHDSTKTAPLALAGCIVGGYAFYAVFIGTANGTQQFHKQAGLDISFATLRAIGLLGAAMAGLGVVGVVGGWVAAVGVILVAAIAWVGLPRLKPDDARVPVGPMVAYFGGVAVYLVLFNAVMFVDSFLLKRLATEHFAAHASELQAALDGVVGWPLRGHFAFDPSVLADVENGYYAAVQNIARVPYQAIIAATFVVFPLVSRSTFTADRDTTRRYIEVTVRYSLMFAMAIAVVMAASPVDVLGLVYAPDYAQLGGPALALLALGYVAFSLFAIAGTILNSAGLTRPAIWTAALTLALGAVGNYLVIPIAVDGGNVLTATAAVSTGAMVVGAIASGLVLRARLGAFLPLASVVRIAVATAAAIGAGHVLPLHGKGKVMTLGLAVVVGVVYLVALVATRELGARDLAAIKQVRAKRAPGGDV